MAKKLMLVTAMALGLAGCVPPAHQPYTIKTPFNEADFAPFRGPGPATLKGQAFLRTVGGDVKTCAGAEVQLVPVTAYWVEILGQPSDNFTNVDSRAASYILRTNCDATGNFEFDNIPAKQWHIITNVTWGIPDQLGGIRQTGGELTKNVDLHAGANSVIVSQ